MSEAATPPPSPRAIPRATRPRVAKRLAFYQRAGGIVTPFLTALFAFLMGGIVVLATGHNPGSVYKAVFEGAGLNWFFHFGNYHVDLPFTNHQVWFWWNTSTNLTAAYNLTQTLLTTTPLILTGLAVAFAFRCGLFNIGGQGQYQMGAIVGVYVGSRSSTWRTSRTCCSRSCSPRSPVRLWGAIAGFLKATVGAHEVITTIMLNWIAYWGGSYLVRARRPAPEPRRQVDPDLRRHRKGRAPARHLGQPGAAGAPQRHLHCAGRADRLLDHPQPNDARVRGARGRLQPGGRPLRRHQRRRNYVIAMAISGTFAGLAGGLDILGWQFRLGVLDVQVSNIGFIGIAVALLGRNTAVGVGFVGAAVRRAADRHLDAQPGSEHLPAAARGQPGADDPGARPAVRRRGPADPLHLAGPEEAAVARRGAAAAEEPV